MLRDKHSATVQCVKDSEFYHIDDPRKYLKSHPEVIWHIAEMLSHRIMNLNKYFVDVKSQHEEPEHQASDAKSEMNYRKIMANEAMKILQIQ